MRRREDETTEAEQAAGHESCEFPEIVASECERLATAVQQAAEAIFITDTEGAIQYVNPAFEQITQFSREEALGKNPRILKSGEHDQEFYRQMWETLTQGKVWQGHVRNKRQDGTIYDAEGTISPIRDVEGRIISYVALQRDVTQEVELEAQLRQSQKMEAVGQLAGGVAHDFNNAMTVILGNVDLLRNCLEGDAAFQDGPRSHLELIEQAAEHAATLTRQLLAFARKQIVKPEVLDPNRVLARMEQMLRRLIREDIALEIVPAIEVGSFRADAGQLEQVIINLVVNARDAMPNGGKLAIQAATAMLDDDYVATHAETRPGLHVMFSVADTGCGMDKQTLERVFEPFFTTKGPDQGTGLGLSTAHGIVRQAGGHMTVSSQPGQGTTFKVYFPALGKVAASTAMPLSKGEPSGGQETILVCEDEGAVRNLMCRALESQGYTVLAGERAEKALELAEAYAGPIALLVVDVNMPDMSGFQLAERIAHRRPETGVLYVSGYPADAISDRDVIDEGAAFLEKPFTFGTLQRCVREVLDKRTSASPKS